MNTRHAAEAAARLGLTPRPPLHHVERGSSFFRAVASATWLAMLLALGCAREGAGCAECGTVVIAATGEPSSLLPPLVYETVGRDVTDQVFERLLVLAPRAAPIDPTGYRPALADRWERVDSLTWRFHLRPGAKWHDGAPVTAADVVFSFAAYADPELETEAAASLTGNVTATAEDSATVLVRFAHAYPEQLYDATWHVRILPEHIWGPIPRAEWAGDTSLARIVGSGPFRVTSWVRGQSLTLEAVPGAATSISRAVWRFVPDPDAAINLLLSGEADLVEHLGPPARVARVAGDSTVRTLRYPSAAYGFLGFRVQDATGRRHPVLGYRDVRRGLAMGVDRAALATAIFGPGTAAPPGPVSQLLWINSPDIRVLPYDTAAARTALAAVGRPVAFDILVPSTSPARRDLAQALQQAWRPLGVTVTITAVDFPVFNERLAAGQFDSYIGAWLDEPSPRGLADQWTRSGWDKLNYGRYDRPAFDALLAAAGSVPDSAAAGALYRAALDTLNADAPALFLYAPVQVAGVASRVQGVTINPYSWLGELPAWTAGPRR